MAVTVPGPVDVRPGPDEWAATDFGLRVLNEMGPEHLLYGVLRVARDPLGSGLGRCGRREMTRLRV